MTTLTSPPKAAARTSAAPANRGRNRPFYRHDLDGLRGIAIGLVAVFHVWFGKVSGGVDVFLTLSGFFFGGSLLRTALAPGSSLSPLPELTRLVRRLLPALVVVLAAAAVLTILIQPETRWETFADQSLASLGYFQNWELAHDTNDYLRAGEAVSPLQHIWSMSVQGQFYVALLVVVFGFAFLARRRLGRLLRPAFVVLIAALTVASFGYAIVVHQENQTHAYYDSFARAWELLIGALVGAAVPYVRFPNWLRNAMALVGLAGVLSCGMVLDGVNEFPGPWALYPVGSALLLILAGANLAGSSRTRGKPPLINRMLASAPLVWLGGIAYSLYLWHWPLLIFWLAHTGESSVGFVAGAGVLAVSVVIAWATTRYVETPLRYRRQSSAPTRATVPLRVRFRRPTIVLGSIVVLLGVALTATSFTWREHVTIERAKGKELSGLSPRDYPGARALTEGARVPKLPMRPSVLEAKKDLPESTDAGCISDFNNGDIKNCVYGDPTAGRTVALAGGSHAEHWITALDTLGKAHHFKVVTYLKMGCPLSTEVLPRIVGDNIPYPACHDWVEHVMDALVADHPDFVFTNTTRPKFNADGDTIPASYTGIWDILQRNGIGILGIRDTPWNYRNGEPFEPADCLADGGDATTCGMKRSDVLSDRNPTLDYLSRYPVLHPLDLSDAICRPDYCRAIEGNVLVYHDSHHLSATYVRTLTAELGRQMGPATGWW
ncbi:acyltransferase [Mycobacterium sp. MYCO198283]|uniref:acyltransferase family protein n=1 Tax=Mycobacterium sp. MYCO198283 TaxID=2883505 RepID=UPI001E41C782|nr:acyltransferase family protein [Mycobacterium sp. MYCO198283]MCG5433525.1 acyltransferase [Mycobacterium sp. MYCO198283]